MKFKGPGRIPEWILEHGFAGVQAVATLVIASIAVWGVFFTNIPELLIRQLRSDVVDARERLADVQRQRRVALEDLHKAKTQLEVGLHERTKLETDLQNLVQSRKRLIGQIARLRRERNVYLQKVRGSQVNLFLIYLSGAQSKFENRAYLARDLPKMRVWIEARRKIKRPKILTRENYVKWNKEWSKWRDSMPKYWQRYMLIKRLGGKADIDSINEFAQSLTRGKALDNSHGVSVIKKILDKNPFKTLLLDDRRRVFLVIRRVIAKHRTKLSSRLALHLKAPLKIPCRGLMM